MRGITTTVFVVLLVLVTVVLAAPPKKEKVDKKTLSKKGGSVEEDEKEGQGPHLIFREPRNLRAGNNFNGERPAGVVVSRRPVPYWQQYRGFPLRRAYRDDDEDDGEDDEEADDDNDETSGEGDDDVQDEEDDYGFDTPSWDSLFPPEESNAAEYTGQAQRSNSGRRKNKQSGRRVINYDSPPSFVLPDGSVGGPSATFRETGRSGISGRNREWGPRWNWKQQSRQQRPDPRSRKAYPEPPPWYKIEEEGPPFKYSWNYSPGPTSFQTKFVPSSNRRNWNWNQNWNQNNNPNWKYVKSNGSGYSGPWSENGPQQQQPQGPRRIQNWSRPNNYGGPPSANKWGYY